MKKILLFLVIAIIGCVNTPDPSKSYLSTEIKKGNSWRYLSTNVYPGMTLKTIYSDISIDNVWGNNLNVFFFIVSKIDSVTMTGIIDSSFVQTQKILCKKTGIKTSCSDILLSTLFSDREHAQHDDDGRGNYSKMINVQFGGRNFKAENVVKVNTIGASKFENINTLFADTVGIISDSIERYGHSVMPFHASTNLLKYNGTDFSYTTTSSPE